MNNNKVIIKTDTGEELSYDIVAMITNKVGCRNIIYFTNNELDTDGIPIVYGAYYVVENNQVKLINEMSEEDFNDIKELYDLLNKSDEDTNLTNVDSNISSNPYADIEVL